MKLSIITINLNNASGLKKTAESVLNQTFREFEYIIIDGESTDGSLEVIKSIENKLTYWVSEPDKGIYNAMNKGWKEATGDYCLFLNSGDELINNECIEVIMDRIQIDINYSVYYCDLVFRHALEQKDIKQIYPDELSLNFFSHSSIGHPGSFIARTLLTELDGYSENYKIISDWYFFVQAYIRGRKFKHLHILSTLFEAEGLSSNIKLLEKEHENILCNELAFLKHDFNSYRALARYRGSKSHTFLNSVLIFLGYRKK